MIDDVMIPYTIEMNTTDKCFPGTIESTDMVDLKKTRGKVCKGNNDRVIKLSVEVSGDMARATFDKFNNKTILTIAPEHAWEASYEKLVNLVKGHGCRAPYFICDEEKVKNVRKEDCHSFKTTCRI
jgi:hypothetical protein